MPRKPKYIERKKRMRMIKKHQIISTLIDYGLSVIECDRALDSEYNFRLVLNDIIDKALREHTCNPQQPHSIRRTIMSILKFWRAK